MVIGSGCEWGVWGRERNKVLCSYSRYEFRHGTRFVTHNRHNRTTLVMKKVGAQGPQGPQGKGNNNRHDKNETYIKIVYHHYTLHICL